MKRGGTKIISVFGQIEGVVADAMAEEGLVTRIEQRLIPPTVLFNDSGTMAHCALVLTEAQERMFDQRVAALRA